MKTGIANWRAELDTAGAAVLDQSDPVPGIMDIGYMEDMDEVEFSARQGTQDCRYRALLCGCDETRCDVMRCDAMRSYGN